MAEAEGKSAAMLHRLLPLLLPLLPLPPPPPHCPHCTPARKNGE
jgi:hypothetical protein